MFSPDYIKIRSPLMPDILKTVKTEEAISLKCQLNTSTQKKQRR